MTGPTPRSDRFDSLSYALSRYRETPRRMSFRAQTAADAYVWQNEARAKLVDLIGPFPEKTIDLDARYETPVKKKGYSRRIVTFNTRLNLSAIGYLLIPDSVVKPSPAVICLPGHGRGIDEIVGIDENGGERDHYDGYQHDFALQCVDRGYVTLALEMLGFGHRRDAAACKAGGSTSSCQTASGAALMLGETMIGWRVWDVLKAIDLMSTRPEVDSDRIVLMGISGGGTVALYAAALDLRVHSTVLSGSFCTFRDSIFSVNHCIDNYVPKILQYFEASDVASLIAPRRLFCESGLEDPIFPKPGVDAAIFETSKAFRAIGVEENFASAFFSAAHVFQGSAAFAQLKQWLASKT